MSTPTEFRCDEDIVRMIELANLPLHALRVIFGLQYQIDSNPGTKVIQMGPPYRRPMLIKARKIVQSTFPSGTNDLRLVRAAKDSLIAAQILDRYDYIDVGQAVEYRYSDKAILAAEERKTGKFAIVDSAWLSQLSTPAQIMLYVRVTMHAGMNAPKFYVPGISAENPWQKVKKPWLSAAEKLSKKLGYGFLFCPEIDRMSEKVVAVRVKISHQKTAWYPGSLYCRTADKPPIAVISGSSQAITRNELAVRSQWTQI